MALFGSKSKDKKADEPKEAGVVAEKKATVPAPVASAAARVLLSARITEKATDLAASKNTYVFNVTPDANKRQVVEAVKVLYKVTPKAVRIVQIPRKSVRHHKAGVYGTSALGKKAYVALKDGDTISLM